MATEELEPTKDELLDAIVQDGELAPVEPVVDAPEYTDQEQGAIDKGWNPEGVEGKKNLSAEEFLDRQSLYDDLHTLKRQNKRLQGDIENINKYQQDIRADERKKVVADLKTQKKEALDEDDHNRVIEIDEQLADAREEAKQEKATTQVNKDFNEWIGDNAWYTDDDELRSEADIYGEIYWTKNPAKSRNEVYDAVSKHIKRSYSDKFENTKRSQPSSVEPATGTPRQTKSKSKLSSKDLPADQRGIMKTILRTTDMTEEEYLKEYFAMTGGA